MRPETLAVHAGGEPDAATGAIAPPLHLATTFAHGPAGERVAGYEYTREGNPTQDRLETALAAMEGGAAALAFASGMAAMNALLEAMPAGERVAGYEYTREGNPTQDRLETALAAMEGGAAALAFASGMAAMNCLLES